MSDMMTFPDTWEEFEKSYGFTDNEEVYTNGSRLIQSFRVKQWLEHLPSAEPKIKPIYYTDCANAMLMMWMDNVITDGEYNKIMDKLNAKHMAERRIDE